MDEIAEPELVEPTDAIVRIDTTTICDTDLRIVAGRVPTAKLGVVLGHEGVGTIVAVGPAVGGFRPGDRVLISCISACGRCDSCRRARYGQCQGGGGWVLGHTIDGVQAEYARIPFADHSLHHVPAGLSDEQVLLLADTLPTSYEVGVCGGDVLPGDTVAVVGTGATGLAAILTARLHTPSRIIGIDQVDDRLRDAEMLGADVVINNATSDTAACVLEITDGLGADVVIESTGRPEMFELATAIARPGGHIANIGAHGHLDELPLAPVWIRDMTVTTGLLDSGSTSRLLRLVASGRLDPTKLVTHRFGFEHALKAYETFADAARTGARKVAICGEYSTSTPDRVVESAAVV